MTAAALAVTTACGGSSDKAGETLAAAPIDSGDTIDPASAPETPDRESIPARLEGDPTGPSADITIKIDQEMLSASASIDGRIADFSPALSERIRADVDLAFEKAKTIAAADAEEGFDSPHIYQYDFVKAASVGDVISIRFFNLVHTGGAHPNYLLGGILHDRASGEDIFPSEILSETGTAAMKTLLMEKLAEAKLERMSMEPQDMPAIRVEVTEVFPKEIEFWFGQVVFWPSTEADKFGGLTVRYSPYDVGSYAEGGYDLVVTSGELDNMLSERYAPMFGGEPVIEEESDD